MSDYKCLECPEPATRPLGFPTRCAKHAVLYVYCTSCLQLKSECVCNGLEPNCLSLQCANVKWPRASPTLCAAQFAERTEALLRYYGARVCCHCKAVDVEGFVVAHDRGPFVLYICGACATAKVTRRVVYHVHVLPLARMILEYWTE